MNHEIKKIDELINLFEEIDNLVHSYPFFEKDNPQSLTNPKNKIISLQTETAPLVGQLDSIIEEFGNRYTKFGDKGKVDMFREATTITDSWGSAILRTVISELRIIKGKLLQDDNTLKKAKDKEDKNNKVFIVHGHNNEILLGVQLMLKELDLEPIILMNEVNKGKTIIEKFEENSNVSFAIVLMTDDDLGKQKKSKELTFRARQNVIFELGYFFAKLGRENVCVLNSNNLEIPSDFYGVLYIPIDQNGAWKYLLLKELREAGFNVDANRIK